MPVEVLGCKGTEAKVRVCCDRCGKFVSTLTIKASEVQTYLKKKHLCQGCFVVENPDGQEAC